MPVTPFRDTFWNISPAHQTAMYVVAILAFLGFALGWYRHFAIWRRARHANSLDRLTARLRRMLAFSFGQRRLAEDRYAGLMHLAIFWPMIVLFLGTLLVALDHDLAWYFLRGAVYLVYKLVLDVAGAVLLVGLGIAVYRRWIMQPAHLERRPGDIVVLLLLGAVAIFGFLLEALRLTATQPGWAWASPVGSALAAALAAFGLSAEAARGVHRVFWWIHAGSAFLFVAAIPFCKLAHVFTGPLSTFFASFGPYGRPRTPFNLIAQDEQEIALALPSSFGAAGARDLSWQQLLAADACANCGRCERACPAVRSGRPFSPRVMVRKVREAAELGQARAATASPEAPGTAPPYQSFGFGLNELLCCTTCAACMRQCPVLVEHVPLIIELRRHLVYEGQFDRQVRDACWNSMRQGNPWGLPWNTRTEWCANLDVRTLAEGEAVEVLYWPGCVAAFDARNQETARSFVALLRVAEVDFAILGNAERCCGDFARRLGDEGLFQRLVERNLATLGQRQVGTIVTTCPHCYNTLRHDYPEFGGHWRVVHHVQLLDELVRAGRLTPVRHLHATLTLHDSCYLGRHNGVYAPPRRLLNALATRQITEMPRSGPTSFCCGAGGGHMWLSSDFGNAKINELRLAEAIQTGVQLVATVCPYCLVMLEEAAQANEVVRSIRIADVAVLIEEAIR